MTSNSDSRDIAQTNIKQASLPGLPQELIDVCATYLDPPDIVACRLTCTSLASKFFNAFATTHFSTINYDFSHYDTEYLKLFAAENPHLPGYVRTLRICKTYCTMQIPGTRHSFGPKPFGWGYHWDRGHDGHVTGNSAVIGILAQILTTEFTKCSDICVVHDSYAKSNAISPHRVTTKDAFRVIYEVFERMELIKPHDWEFDFWYENE